MAALRDPLDKALPGWMNHAYGHFNRIDYAKIALWWSIQTTKALVFEEHSRLYSIWSEHQKKLDSPPRKAKKALTSQ